MSSDYRCPEAVWAILRELIPPRPVKDHPLGCYRKPIDDRRIADAIWYVMKTGCQWQALDQTHLARHSVAHARFQEWVRAGVFQKLWEKTLEGFDCLVGLDWQWLAVDGALGKAPLGGEKNRAQPHRPRQKGSQAFAGRRRPRRASGPGGGAGQRQRLPALGTDAGHPAAPAAGDASGGLPGPGL